MGDFRNQKAGIQVENEPVFPPPQRRKKLTTSLYFALKLKTNDLLHYTFGFVTGHMKVVSLEAWTTQIALQETTSHKSGTVSHKAVWSNCY